MSEKFTPPILVGRPPDRKHQIMRQLRREIVSGALAPGAPFPTREAIISRFGASPGTVNSAVDGLRGEGFIEPRGRQGTFVTLNPPHLTRYAVLFAVNQDTRHWTGYYTALSNVITEANRSAAEPGPTISTYSNLHRTWFSRDFRALTEDVVEQRIAGLIFATSPYDLKDTPLVEDDGLPRVAVAAIASDWWFPTVSLDGASFRKSAVGYLAGLGRKRVAVIGPHRSGDWESAIAAQGLETRPYWLHPVNVMAAEAAHGIAHLLTRLPAGDRPDALVVTDDNLLDHVLAGLLAAGVRLPDELAIVAHCNFDGTTTSVLPLARLGYDARRVLSACIGLIDAQRRGETPDAITRVPAQFAWEIHPPLENLDARPVLPA